jgi:hypothetical protein
MPSKTSVSFFLCALLPVLSLPALVQAENGLARPNWDRVLALQSAALGDYDGQRQEWLRQLRAGNYEAVLQSIRQFSAASEPTSPAREQQLFLFTVALADFPAEQVPAALLAFLANYSPQTLVAHEESGNHAVALFNIPAAARGVQSEFTRQRAEARAATLLTGSAEVWIRNYLDASPAARAGFLAALDVASSSRLLELDRNARGLMDHEPDLAVVAGRTALAMSDVQSMRHVLELGSGSDVTSMLRSAAGKLSSGDRAELLLLSIESAPSQNAALAIALLSPGLQAVPQVISTLFDLLGDPELGSAAALALARIDEPLVEAQLVQLAGSEGLAATRARMAISLRETQAMPGTQR